MKHFQKLFNSRRCFLSEVIEIAKFLKLDEDVEAFQENFIESLVEEAEERGKSSKIVKAALLQQALGYSARVGNKEKIQQLKKDLSQIDYSDELKEITLPKEEIRRLKWISRQHYKSRRDSIKEYIDRLGRQSTLQILWNICNDDTIIRIDLQKTKEFVEELMREHPIRDLFSTMLDTGQKRIQIESPEDKKRFRLNEQLILYIKETIWLVTHIFGELTQRNLLTEDSVGIFLSNCSCVSKKDLRLISAGAHHHFQKDYVAAVSILTPLVESVLFNCLSSIDADVSSFEGKITERRELGGLISLEEVRKNFGENFQYFLKLFLVEPDSFNFRNRITHGMAESSEFNESTSSIILFLILKICSKTFKPAAATKK